MDPLSAIGIAANIMQVVQFGGAVIERLETYRSKTGELPDAFQHISNRLPALIHKLKETEAATKTGAISTEDRKVLKPMIDGCMGEMEYLKGVLDKVLPKLGDSSVKRGLKAIGSLRWDSRVEKSAKVIQDYVVNLTYFAVATPSTARMSFPWPDPDDPTSSLTFVMDIFFRILTQLQHSPLVNQVQPIHSHQTLTL